MLSQWFLRLSVITPGVAIFNVQDSAWCNSVILWRQCGESLKHTETTKFYPIAGRALSVY